MNMVDCFDRRRARRIVAAPIRRYAGVVVADRATEIGKALLVLEQTGDVTLTCVGLNVVRSKLTVRGAVWFFLYTPTAPEIVSHDEGGDECATKQTAGNVPNEPILI